MQKSILSEATYTNAHINVIYTSEPRDPGHAQRQHGWQPVTRSLTPDRNTYLTNQKYQCKEQPFAKGAIAVIANPASNYTNSQPRTAWKNFVRNKQLERAR